jgi:hypothetical protein
MFSGMSLWAESVKKDSQRQLMITKKWHYHLTQDELAAELLLPVYTLTGNPFLKTVDVGK